MFLASVACFPSVACFTHTSLLGYWQRYRWRGLDVHTWKWGSTHNTKAEAGLLVIFGSLNFLLVSCRKEWVFLFCKRSCPLLPHLQILCIFQHTNLPLLSLWTTLRFLLFSLPLQSSFKAYKGCWKATPSDHQALPCPSSVSVEHGLQSWTLKSLSLGLNLPCCSPWIRGAGSTSDGYLKCCYYAVNYYRVPLVIWQYRVITLDKAHTWKGSKFMTEGINGSLQQPFSGFGLQLGVCVFHSLVFSFKHLQKWRETSYKSKHWLHSEALLVLFRSIKVFFVNCFLTVSGA